MKPLPSFSTSHVVCPECNSSIKIRLDAWATCEPCGIIMDYVDGWKWYKPVAYWQAIADRQEKVFRRAEYLYKLSMSKQDAP